MTMTTHTAKIGWQRAKHGQRTTTAGQSSDSERFENIQEESVREWETKRAKEHGARVSTAAPATMRMC